MPHVPLWKPLVILLVLGLCGLSLYPPSERLKPGLDLQGGTTLVYDVTVPEDKDTDEAIAQTIEILKNRVDPQGVRNLVWRQRAGSRIEIQMPAAPPKVRERREDFRKARERLFAGNITEGQLESALRADPAQRKAVFEKWAGDRPERRERLAAAAEAYDAMQAAEEPYREAEEKRRAARRAREALPADAPAEKREKLEKRLEAARDAVAEPAKRFNAARKAYEQARQRILEANISPQALERVLSLSDQAPGKDAQSPRDEAVQELVAAHPGRKGAIKAVVRAYEAYERVKGPLDDPNDLINLLKGSGEIAFRIAPRPQNIDAETYRDRLEERGPRGGTERPYQWFPVDDLGSFADEPEQRERIKENPARYFQRNRNMVAAKYGGRIYLLLADSPGKAITSAQEGWELTSAGRTQDQRGFPAVRFELNPVGAQLMGNLTAAHKGEPMAIVLDGRVISAPTIQGRIAGRGQITGGPGGFSEQELDHMLRTLRAGSPPAQLSAEPISIKTIGPRFGQDNLDAGVRAAVWALVAVALFMAVYYLFWGGLSDFALAANMVVILGVMAMLQATFTLPGIAGIVLTIGMAVDANVLVFERIREERVAGSDLPTSIRLGYQHATSTVLDANLTTLITCIVLGYTATAEVKGFAVTLGIGILATLFTVLFCTRVLVELYINWKPSARLSMLPSLVPSLQRLLTPKVDWLGKRRVYLAVSVVLIAGGIAAVGARGADLLDIEFRSGTQVSFELAEGERLSMSAARQRLTRATKELDPLLAEEIREAEQPQRKQRLERNREALGLLTGKRVDLVTVGPTRDGRAGAFTISTLATNPDLVSRTVKRAFSDVLETSRPINFDGQSAEDVEAAPVFPVEEGRLGPNIDRPGNPQDVSEHRGGVAIVLDDLEPPATPAAIRERIERMRMQPAYADLGYRRFEVIGLELADAAAPGAEGAARYRSVAVVSSDERTNYLESPDAFSNPKGLAATEWRLVRDALQRDTSLGSVSNFSGQVSQTMQRQALVALALALLAVVAYIWIRFAGFGTGFVATVSLAGSAAVGITAGAIVHYALGEGVGGGFRLLASGLVAAAPPVALLVWIAVRHPRLRYGPAAMLALVHDVTIALGLVAATAYVAATPIGSWLLIDPFRIDLALVAAMLTIVGYSLNDTIVVFDRIRENRGKLVLATPGIVNNSINQTISRTALTSTSTLLALLVLYVFGGPGVHGFAFALMVGVLIGTYSSICVASPTLLLGRLGREADE